MNSTDKQAVLNPSLAEIFQAATPLVLIICSTCLGIAALMAHEVTDSVRISFAGAAATGYGAAAGLARSPTGKPAIKQEIAKADNVDVTI